MGIWGIDLSESTGDQRPEGYGPYTLLLETLAVLLPYDILAGWHSCAVYRDTWFDGLHWFSVLAHRCLISGWHSCSFLCCSALEPRTSRWVQGTRLSHFCGHRAIVCHVCRPYS